MRLSWPLSFSDTDSTAPPAPRRAGRGAAQISAHLQLCTAAVDGRSLFNLPQLHGPTRTASGGSQGMKSAQRSRAFDFADSPEESADLLMIRQASTRRSLPRFAGHREHLRSSATEFAPPRHAPLDAEWISCWEISLSFASSWRRLSAGPLRPQPQLLWRRHRPDPNGRHPLLTASNWP